MVGYYDPPKDHQFKQGISGNPNGRPPGVKSFKAIIKEMAEKEINYKDLNNKKISTKAGEAMIIALFAKAIYKNDAQAAKILLEHVEGNKTIHANDVENPLISHTIDTSKLTTQELISLKAALNATDKG